MKNKLNTKGFSLTEVLVGVLVLTMAIVSASNFLISMMKSNTTNTSVLQAYYCSVEGLEAFRNIRDTYFMNYLNYCGEEDEGGNGGLFRKKGFCEDGSYTVELKPDYSDGGVFWELEQIKNPDLGNSGDAICNRICEVSNYSLDGSEGGIEAKEITCTTRYENGSKTGEISLKTILTDWQ